MFWIGILPAFLVFYIRRHVPEPDVFAKTKKQMEAKGEKSHFLEIFSPAMLRTTLLTSLLATGAQGGYYAITTFLPTFLKTVRKLSVLNTGAYTWSSPSRAPGSGTWSGLISPIISAAGNR